MRTPLITRVLATAGLTAAALLSSGAGPAHAAARDGHCDDGEFCYFYNSDNQGSVSDFTSSVPDYGTTQPGCYDFKGDGAGKGDCIKNNAASVWNRTSGDVTVYFNTGYDGATDVIDKGFKGNLNSTLYNENASHRLGTSTSRTALSAGLYKLSGGRVTCGFDGYSSTPGRHEGIDIARSIGSPVRALVSGTITYVAQGARGGSGLSTIAVYNPSYDKTVIYLHSDPYNSLSVGQSISKGEQIAVEDYRGVSSSSSAHTHVEMRPGRQTHASKSVGDPHLDNPDPTSFWHAAGYDER